MSVPRFRTSAFYNGLGSFKAAFPTLFDAMVEWEELNGPDDPGKGRNRRKMGHRRGNFNRGLISCGNADCWEGGYPIDRVIDDMVANEENARDGVLYCGGRELPEEGKRQATRCRRRIRYRVTLSTRQARKAA